MPAAEHLRWFEVSKFKGLWTNGGKFLMPADHAQVMSGCLPQKAGGLRAFFLPTVDRDGSGLEQTDPAYTRTIRGFGLMADPADVPGNYYSLIISNGANDFGLWTRSSANGTAPATATSSTAWIRKTTASHNGTSHTAKRPYMVTWAHLGSGSGLSGGSQFLFCAHNWIRATGAYQGTNSAAPATAPVTNAVVGTQLDCGPLTVHQNRIVLGAENALIGSPPRDGTLAAAPVQIVPDPYGTPSVAPNTAPLVAWVLSIPPADLLVGMLSGAIYNIQGDLADPTIRELGRWGTTAPQQPVNTPYGPIVIFPGMGPTVVGTDGSIQNIGEPLDPAAWTVDLTGEEPYFGALVFASGYLFAPNLVDATLTPNPAATVANNGAMVYDFATGAWFTSAHPEVMRCINPRFLATSSGRANSGVFVAAGETLGHLTPTSHPIITRYPASATGYFFDGAVLRPHSRARSWRFEWTSAPFRDPDCRQTDVQEIQIGTLGWTASGTVVVTVRGSTGESFTKTVAVSLGKATHRIPIRLRADYVEVSLKSSTDQGAAGTGEAPSIDFVRVGYEPGHRR